MFKKKLTFAANNANNDFSQTSFLIPHPDYSLLPSAF
jgi:hypothetical protein